MTNNKRLFGKTLFALAMMIGLMNTFATTAQADDWHGHQGRGNAQHERYVHDRHYVHHVYARPVFVERQPVVYYYAPPMIMQTPQYDTASSGINITFQLN